MKHIKKFESLDSKLHELRNLCNEILVSMTDNDFTVIIQDMSNNFGVIEIFKTNYSFFKWSDIKDYIIFLINYIKEDYDILYQSIDMFCVGYGSKSYSISDIISDDLKNDTDKNFMSISIDIRF